MVSPDPDDLTTIDGTGFSLTLPPGLRAELAAADGLCIERFSSAPCGALRIVSSLFRWPQPTYLMVDGIFGAWVEGQRSQGKASLEFTTLVELPNSPEPAISCALAFDDPAHELERALALCARTSATDVVLIEARFPAALRDTFEEPARASLSSFRIHGP